MVLHVCALLYWLRFGSSLTCICSVTSVFTIKPSAVVFFCLSGGIPLGVCFLYASTACVCMCACMCVCTRQQRTLSLQRGAWRKHRLATWEVKQKGFSTKSSSGCYTCLRSPRMLAKQSIAAGKPVHSDLVNQHTALKLSKVYFACIATVLLPKCTQAPTVKWCWLLGSNWVIPKPFLVAVFRKQRFFDVAFGDGCWLCPPSASQVRDNAVIFFRFACVH